MVGVILSVGLYVLVVWLTGHASTDPSPLHLLGLALRTYEEHSLPKAVELVVLPILGAVVASAGATIVRGQAFPQKRRLVSLCATADPDVSEILYRIFDESADAEVQKLQRLTEGGESVEIAAMRRFQAIALEMADCKTIFQTTLIDISTLSDDIFNDIREIQDIISENGRTLTRVVVGDPNKFCAPDTREREFNQMHLEKGGNLWCIKPATYKTLLSQCKVSDKMADFQVIGTLLGFSLETNSKSLRVEGVTPDAHGLVKMSILSGEKLLPYLTLMVEIDKLVKKPLADGVTDVSRVLRDLAAEAR